MLRSLMLKLAGSRTLLSLVERMGRKYGIARRFVAGDTMEEAIGVVRQLNSRGIRASLDLLGEGITESAEAERAAAAYRDLLEGIHASGVDSNISIKPTQLGLEIDPQLCLGNLREVLKKAGKFGNFVRIDMESSAFTERTIQLFRAVRSEFPSNVGLVLQAYLYRSEADVRELAGAGCNLRLCKGAYMESASVAFPKKADVDRNFLKLIDIGLESPGFTAIATHDDAIIAASKRHAGAKRIPRDRYEFQMLYGVRREALFALNQEGIRTRVYVPFGTRWAPYFMRRLAERPANALFVLKNLFRR